MLNMMTFVQTVRPSVPLPQEQPECFYEPATRLVDCANWAVRGFVFKLMNLLSQTWWILHLQ